MNNNDLKIRNIEYMKIYINLFSTKTLVNFAKNRQNTFIEELIKFSPLLKLYKINTYKDLFTKTYNTLITNNYHSEYIFKNDFFKTQILNKHNLDAIMLNEVNTNNAKLDLLVVNGTTTAYEIKTDLDSNTRLYSQLENYVHTYDRVNLITTEKQLSKMEKIINSNHIFNSVGIYLFDIKSGIKEYKKNNSNIDILDKNYILKTINQSEIKKYYFNDNLIECQQKFLLNTNEKAHEIFIDILRKRDSKYSNNNLIDDLPSSLKFAGFKLKNLNNNSKKIFIEKLNRNITI